jgi:hypothetical protein
MIEVLLLSLGIVGISFLALGFRVLFVKKGKFPNSSVGGNKALRQYGLQCARGEEIARFKKVMRQRINPKELKLAQED